MFFIGIFGISEKSKIIFTEQNIICPACNAYGRYDVIMSYSYFHAFFIPLFKWNKRYFLQTRCCNKLCNLDYDIGLKIQNGERVEIKEEHIHCNDFHAGRAHYTGYKFCSHCSSQVDAAFQYCPHCGNKYEFENS
jgi:RNA polymerase subunit RPABC4/transcription elongation factor Spt4